MKITFKNPFYDYEEDKLFLNQFKIPEEINITESKTRKKITNGIKKADSMLKGSNVNLNEKDKGDFYASFAKQSLWDGIDDFKVKEARKEGYSALNASKAKRTNIQKELEEYAKLHKDKKEEKKLAPNRTLSKVSKVLDTASTIPTLDRFASAWQAPIDLAKGDYVSAALDVAGSVSGSSGISKLAKELWKTLKKQDKKTLDKISNTLTAASLIPYADTVTNALQVPVDLARGDYFGAGMSALGVIPVYGEFADAAKAGRTAGKALKAVSEGVELADDIGDTAKIADDVMDSAKVVDEVDDIADTVRINKWRNINYTKVGVEDIPSMDEIRFSKIKESLEKQGVAIIQDVDGDKFLKGMGAEAITLSDGSAIIFQSGRVPSASAVFEETIHVSQIRKKGIIGSTGNKQDVVEYLNREIEANEKLITNKTFYGLTEKDVESVMKNLKVYYKKLKEVK